MNTAIVLTKSEKEIFDTLLKANEKLNLGSVIRVAGGWVRDKLLEQESNDIDITIDNMSGLKFATAVSNFLNSDKKVAVIEANPEKSKHIETAVLL